MRPRVFPAEDKLSRVSVRPIDRLASMRPRVFPAEDLTDALPAVREKGRFNEAAGIPRGRRSGLRKCCGTTSRFNEAAGIPRGRPTVRPRSIRRHRRFNEAAGIPRGRLRDGPRLEARPVLASMRPRVFPAEDPDGGSGGGSDARVASMRPRVFPAEDSDTRARQTVPGGASMRPRVFPAEDRHRGRPELLGRPGFNEAAGIPRGRQQENAALRGRVRASMRPRVFPAEDYHAAAKRHGVFSASMRPRVFPAEDYITH